MLLGCVVSFQFVDVVLWWEVVDSFLWCGKLVVRECLEVLGLTEFVVQSCSGFLSVTYVDDVYGCDEISRGLDVPLGSFDDLARQSCLKICRVAWIV